MPALPAALVLGVLALQPALSSAAPLPVTLRLCVSGQALTPEGIGVFHQRVLSAARGVMLNIEHYAAPRARCLQDTRMGVADALIGVFTPERQAWLAYPMRQALPIAEQGVGSIQVRIYRRAGTRVEWDGRSFTGLDEQPLGLKFGSSYGAELARLGVPLDDRAKTDEQLIAKLIRGRVGAILLTDEATQDLAQIPPGKVEPLARAYSTMPLYLAVSTAFDREHGLLVRQLWANLAGGAERKAPPAGR